MDSRDTREGCPAIPTLCEHHPEPSRSRNHLRHVPVVSIGLRQPRWSVAPARSCLGTPKTKGGAVLLISENRPCHPSLNPRQAAQRGPSARFAGAGAQRAGSRLNPPAAGLLPVALPGPESSGCFFG